MFFPLFFGKLEFLCGTAGGTAEPTEKDDMEGKGDNNAEERDTMGLVIYGHLLQAEEGMTADTAAGGKGKEEIGEDTEEKA